MLIGIISYSGSFDAEISGHFIAYVKEGTVWYEIDDTKDDIRMIPANEQMNFAPQLLLYVKDNVHQSIT